MSTLLDMYRTHRKAALPKPPAGFMTVTEWAAREKKTSGQTNKLLNELSQPGGPIEKKRFRVATEWGIRWVAHFRRRSK